MTGYSIGSPSTPSGSHSSSSSGGTVNIDYPTSTTTAPAVPPSPTDFAVDVVITEQQCFGSAGCNYELSVTPRYVGLGTLTGNWTVVYEITGGEDPQTGNFTIDGDNVRWDEKKRIGGDAGAVFTAKVTQVVKKY